MICPKCREDTHGCADPEYLLSLFGAPSTEFHWGEKETILRMVCDKCDHGWMVDIKFDPTINERGPHESV